MVELLYLWFIIKRHPTPSVLAPSKKQLEGPPLQSQVQLYTEGKFASNPLSASQYRTDPSFMKTIRKTTGGQPMEIMATVKPLLVDAGFSRPDIGKLDGILGSLATIAGAVSMLANFAIFFGGHSRNNPLGIIGAILIMILAPLAAALVQMAISRTREYAADAGGAEICGQPLWLASALAKLEQGALRIENEEAEANPATAHMFIVNPLHTHSIDNLFSTHPNTENRIRRLRQLAGAAGPWD